MDRSKQQTMNLGTQFEPVTLELPWPPSVNHYFMEYSMPPAAAKVEARIEEHGYDGLHTWLRRNTRIMKRVSEKGHEYRAAVLAYVLENRLNKGYREPLLARMSFYPPDRRERDLDNHYKSLFDALEHAAVYRNDSQVKAHNTRLFSESPERGGRVVVVFEELVY